MKAMVAALALLSSLVMVAWRQSRALEALATLDETRRERVLAESTRAELERGVESLESRARVVSAARTRLGMRTPEAVEIVLLAGDDS